MCTKPPCAWEPRRAFRSWCYYCCLCITPSAAPSRRCWMFVLSCRSTAVLAPGGSTFSTWCGCVISIMARKGMVVRGVRVRSEKWADHSRGRIADDAERYTSLLATHPKYATHTCTKVLATSLAQSIMPSSSSSTWGSCNSRRRSAASTAGVALRSRLP